MKLLIYILENNNPYENLAFENLLLDNAKEDEIIFYLWQNSPCIVIGKNQNPYAECNLEEMEKEGVHLVRRKTGGGAVYHDLENLNFTFIMNNKIYNYERQCGIILSALKSLGINGEIGGRNDLLTDGKKFSGSAFTIKKDFSCHHGTLLINADMGRLKNLLNPSKLKLASKGISSVAARVVNLKQINPDITVEKIKKALVMAAQNEYNISCKVYYNKPEIDSAELERLGSFYKSKDFIYGSTPPFTIEFSHRFSFGEVSFLLKVVKGVIEGGKIYSDSLITDIDARIMKKIVGSVFEKESLINSLEEDL